jgi:hypothetical protein
VKKEEYVMAALKRNRGTWILILLLATGFFLLRERRSSAVTNTDLTITTARTFASLDGSIDDDDGLANGVFTKNANLTIANGGSITCNDGPPLPATASGCDITLVVTGTLEIQAGGSINADNNINGGHGGTIDITVGGDFNMRGPSGGHAGALITSQHKGGGTDNGGKITIVVGGVTLDTSVDPAIGVCGSPNGDILIEKGATITSDSNTHRAGDIALYAGHNITISGTVRAQGGATTGHGGSITIDACCDLLIEDSGLVRSAGQDPGAGRVHLEACVVTIFGVVESTAGGHEFPTPNCTPPIRPGKPANSSACVEIWSGTTLTIDATGTHKGQVNADTGMAGGPNGGGWIDVLANEAITLIGNTTTPYNAGGNINDNSLVTPAWVLHANMKLQNGHGGDIAVQSTSGTVTTSGRAIQANASTGSNGGKGGHVKVEASSNVAFGMSSIQAMGDTTGGGSQRGGTIVGRSFNGTLTGGPPPGQLDAAGPSGSITLFACLGVTYTGVSNPAFAIEVGPACGDPVVLPEPANTLLPLAICSAFCVPQTPTPTPTHISEELTVTPTPGGPPCTKSEVIGALAGHVPDVIVRLDLNQSIQAAVTGASDTNNDGFIIVLVVKDGTGVLGGHTNQRVTISQVYPKPFQLFGCSVTMHDPDKADGLATGYITAGANSPGNIFIMDLHGADSDVAGWKVEGNGRSVRNTGGSGSPTGIWFVGNNNIMHNGSAGSNSGVGLKIEGNGNYVTDTDAFGNSSHGVQVTGNSNQLLKIDAGDRGKGNGGDGLKVTGNSNTIQEVDAYANGLNGFEVSGSGNSLSKNVAGDRGDKANGGAGFLLSGGSSLVENEAIGNTGDGFHLTTSGFSLSKNVSGGSGSGYPNGGCQYNVLVAGNTNLGGNESNGVTVVGNPFPTGCTN